MRQKLPPLGHIQRKNYLKERYGTQTQHELALSCHVSRSTIARDIAKWKASGDYDEWLDQRWHELLEDPDILKRTKFLELGKLKLRRTSQRLERQAEISGTITLKWLDDDATDRTVQTAQRSTEISS